MNEKQILAGIRTKLLAMVDEPYKSFQQRLIPDVKRYAGVRLPLLRKLAKRLAGEEAAAYLEEALSEDNEEELFEEIMLQGMVIGYLDWETEEVFRLAERFVEKIDNWSVCDSFCSGFKIAVGQQEKTWNWIQRYLYSEQEYEARFGLVMALNYFVTPYYLPFLFAVFDNGKREGYYAKMACAWAVSVCYAKYPNETADYLRNHMLDDVTYAMSLQKMIESNRISVAEKAKIRTWKRQISEKQKAFP